MENQNASAEYPHIPAKGSLQTALCRWLLPAALAVAAGHGKPLCGWEEFFFQIAAFLLREGGGVSPSTLECRLI